MTEGRKGCAGMTDGRGEWGWRKEGVSRDDGTDGRGE